MSFLFYVHFGFFIVDIWQLQIITHESFICFCSQIEDLKARLQKEKDELTAANETVMQRVEQLTTENGDLTVINAELKVQVAK